MRATLMPPDGGMLYVTVETVYRHHIPLVKKIGATGAPTKFVSWFQCSTVRCARIRTFQRLRDLETIPRPVELPLKFVDVLLGAFDQE